MKLLKRLVWEDDGAGILEYAILVALIAVVAIVGVGIFGTALNDYFAALFPGALN